MGLKRLTTVIACKTPVALAMARSFSDLRGLTFPKLVNLLRHGTPVPIHGRQAMLFSVEIGAGSEITGRSIAEVDDCRKRSAHGQKGFYRGVIT